MNAPLPTEGVPGTDASSFEDALAACLDAIESGQATPAEAAAHFPEHLELVELLRLAQAISAAPLPGRVDGREVPTAVATRALAAVPREDSDVDETLALALDECLALVERGEATPAEAAALHPDHVELNELLDLAQALRNLPRPDEKKLSGFLPFPVVPATKPRFLPARVQASTVVRFASRPALRAAVVLAPVMLAWSAIAPAAQAAVPGEPLYPIKRLWEQVELAITVDDAARAQVRLSLVDRRLKEASSGTVDARMREGLLSEAMAEVQYLRTESTRLPDSVSREVASRTEELRSRGFALEGRPSRSPRKPGELVALSVDQATEDTSIDPGAESVENTAPPGASALASISPTAPPTAPTQPARPAPSGATRQGSSQLKDDKPGPSATPTPSATDTPGDALEKQRDNKTDEQIAETAAPTPAAALARTGGGRNTSAFVVPVRQPTPAPAPPQEEDEEDERPERSPQTDTSATPGPGDRKDGKPEDDQKNGRQPEKNGSPQVSTAAPAATPKPDSNQGNNRESDKKSDKKDAEKPRPEPTPAPSSTQKPDDKKDGSTKQDSPPKSEDKSSSQPPKTGEQKGGPSNSDGANKGSSDDRSKDDSGSKDNSSSKDTKSGASDSSQSSSSTPEKREDSRRAR